MTYSARTLITDAYYTSNIVGIDLETPTGSQITQGLKILNNALSSQNVNGRLIPYFQTYTLNLVVGQELYFIPNLIEIEVDTFDIGSVRYSMAEKQRKRYFGAARANNINSLPLSWNQERTLGGTNLRVYFNPNQIYPMHFIGKFGLDDTVQLDDDLSTVYDKFYLEYFQYYLAQRYCGQFSISLTPENLEILQDYTQKLRDMTKIDLTMFKVSTLQKRVGYSYADINLGRGYQPPL